MENTGQPDMGDRESTLNTSAFIDLACAGDSIGRTNNFLDMGSETPHQMAWYWMTLATEWKLLKESNQHNEAQRTLEELVLGLQAYRRLDIAGNCLAAARYQEITDGFETGTECGGGACLCPDKYAGDRWNFDSPCAANCNYIPQTDGYSGFFLREDATQALEAILHDPSEGKWNIDLIGGNAYSMSLSPPCTTSFSQTCYLVHRRGFMSQDGIFSILMGLAMIKRFIPANANVTTCEGAVFYPLQMAIDIAGAITDRVDNTYHDRIMWPGSDECCDKTVYLSNREGGRLLWAIHGVKKAYSYIDGAERHSRTSEYFHWSLLKTQTSTIDNTNEVFWLRLKTIGWDMGDDEKRSLYESTCITEGMEILPLMNNILHPDSDGSDIGINKEQFKAMLCAAPCGGPCKKKQDYSNDNPEWPTFECGNNPGWPGQCWERGRKATDASDANRQFNGLDFMILYNLYLLYFPEERTAYFHPDRPQGNISVGITGPDVLCDENMGHYTLLSPQPDAIQNLLWTTSSNLAIVGQPVLEADIKAGAPIYTPSFIRASFTEKSAIPQYFDGDIQGTTTVADFCEMTYYKPIISLVPGYSTTTQLNHCQGIYDFHAVSTSPDLAGTVYAWKIEIHPVTGPVTSEVLEGKDPHINQWQWLPEKSGYLIIKLKITTPCGETEASAFGVTYDCGPGGQLIVAPNPATNSDQVTVRISQEKDYLMNAKGVEVRFLRTGTGSVQKIERISQNGQSVSIAHFPPGNYTVQVVLEDRTVLTTTLVVSEK